MITKGMTNAFELIDAGLALAKKPAASRSERETVLIKNLFGTDSNTNGGPELREVASEISHLGKVYTVFGRLIYTGMLDLMIKHTRAPTVVADPNIDDVVRF
jgi:hypothetical protein